MTLSIIPNIFERHETNTFPTRLVNLRPDLHVSKEQMSPLVCIGRWLYIADDEIRIPVECIFVSAKGHVVFILQSNIADADMGKVLECLGKISEETLDNIASSYFYSTFGKSYLIRDIMTRHGHWTFGNADSHEAKIDLCLSNRSFSVMCLDRQ